MPTGETPETIDRDELLTVVESFAELLRAMGAPADLISAVEAYAQTVRSLGDPVSVELIGASRAFDLTMRSIGAFVEHNNRLRSNARKVHGWFIAGSIVAILWLFAMLRYGMEPPQRWTSLTKAGFDLFVPTIVFLVLAITAVIPSISSLLRIGSERAVAQFGSSATLKHRLRAGYTESLHPILHLILPCTVALISLVLLFGFLFKVPLHWQPLLSPF